MELSLAGSAVLFGLLLLGALNGAAVVVGLFASLAFGSTAIASLSIVGGSSPQIYTVFALSMITTMLANRRVVQNLASILRRFRIAWLMLLILVYAILSAIFFPRMFAGATTVFVTAPRSSIDNGPKIGGAVLEVLLAPTSGNFTQTAYFVAGGLTFFAFSIWLLTGDRLSIARRGFFAVCIVNAALGGLDLSGKLIGVGDILEPIRTASYAMATSTAEAGFWRIAGGHSEASAFGSMALACLAFTFTFWRMTSQRLALALSLVLFGLLVLSTSTTAYAGLFVIGLPVAASLVVGGLGQHLTRNDIKLIGFGLSLLAIALAIAIANEQIADAFLDLFETMILNKSSSYSALERGYWNMKSLHALADTGGLGIGLGSSRASSWIIAIVSQLGVFGALLMAMIVLDLAVGGRGNIAADSDIEAFALERGARACGLTVLVASSVSAGSADPGILFFVCLSVVLVCRERRRSLAGTPSMNSAKLLHDLQPHPAA